MHCDIDKSLCILLLLNSKLADQTLCLIAMPGKDLVKLFLSVVIKDLAGETSWIPQLKNPG